MSDKNEWNQFREPFKTKTNDRNCGRMKRVNYIEGDNTMFEQEPLRKLAAERQLKSYYHQGFWQCMDTQREKQKLEALWASGNAPWKIWDK